MKKNTTKNIKTVTIIGIGGGACFYIAKYFYNLNANIIGFDINKNDKTDKLGKLGVKIEYKNPDKPFKKDTDLIIYSSALPNHIIEKIKKDNPKINFEEVGIFTKNLIESFEKNKLSNLEKIAFKKSEIAPLFDLNTKNVKIIGVTGTDGKTTTCEMVYTCLKADGKKVGLVSTLGAKINGKSVETGLHTTTPSNQELYNLLNKMIQKKCSFIVLETTSHALVTGRIAGLKFDVVTVTNITKDHLDYHKNYKEYIKAKSLLFRKYLKKEGTAILNYDDKKSFDYLKNLVKNKIIYSKNPTKRYLAEKGIKIYIKSFSKTEGGYIIIYVSQKGEHAIKIPLEGEYNISNALAAIAVVLTLGIKNTNIKKGIETMPNPKGRMEILQKTPFMVIVDFAHTENAFENVLYEATNLKKNTNKLIVVFGCAGKRDSTKRKPMGSLAGRYADITVLTAEDPRTESLVVINNEIEKGWVHSTKDSKNSKTATEFGSITKNRNGQVLIRYDDETQKEHIRRKAIARALREAHHGDIVLITGKGHENSLCFGDTEYGWNDIEEIKKLINTP
ncbi:hypothetical protein COV24_01600 [candidate division WWE3 bacterium CG10_big_fil_rev_8_21_14_0_10_32_10]|uniref:UDP-N-acetylmuramyl-tripeptide synthetase n=1 Tax=candidate division WWE3 bacterium CG10_big_fil_rev_8_21_14_0_10_32_10 TaxID=1975090 RepID=A0A2H0RAU8_UNCKA|nr:MAG: hypothetical protein COV24_01600 [candidate division WWE3 bacterium CG10_big_fil_rev_8_21_14_0_10_32_10]